MASPQARDHALSCAHRELLDFDPDSASATDVKWVDMQNYRTFLVGVMRSVGTGTISSFSLLANASSTGAGTDVTVKTHAIGSAPNAVGDYIWLEVSAEEVAQEAADAGITGVRYVSANIALQTSTDECVVYYELCDPRFAYDGLTADYIS